MGLKLGSDETRLVTRSIPARLLTEPVRDRWARPLRDLRVSLIDRCNFRCPYCMPSDRFPEHHPFLKSSQRMADSELLSLLEVFVGLGVRKLRLTGGEPLLVRGLERLIGTIKQRWPALELALTTNGSLLAARAAGLRAAGLDRLTVSLDAIDPEVFANLSGQRGEVATVLQGIAAARAAGFSPVKLNCVVIRGRNEHQILPLVEFFRGTSTVLRFIEYMDVGTLNHWSAADVVSAGEIREYIGARHPLVAVPEPDSSAVAQRWRLQDGSLELGLISSVSQPFCGGCTRARLSADGQLFTCLFAGSGHDLLGPMRSGLDAEGLHQRILGIWSQRDDRYSELRGLSAASSERAEMYHLGG